MYAVSEHLIVVVECDDFLNKLLLVLKSTSSILTFRLIPNKQHTGKRNNRDYQHQSFMPSAAGDV